MLRSQTTESEILFGESVLNLRCKNNILSLRIRFWMWPVSVFFVSFLPGIILLLSSLSKYLTTSRRRCSLYSTRFLNLGKESNFFEHPLAMKWCRLIPDLMPNIFFISYFLIISPLTRFFNTCFPFNPFDLHAIPNSSVITFANRSFSLISLGTFLWYLSFFF
jgi:hypothetical protein